MCMQAVRIGCLGGAFGRIGAAYLRFLGGRACERELAKGCKLILGGPCSVGELAELGLFCLALLGFRIVNMALDALQDFAPVRSRGLKCALGVPRVRCHPRALP